MTDDHDRIDLSIDVDVAVSSAWDFVSEPGWFINEGELVEHDVTWDGSTATVVDRNHGKFQFRREASDPPRYLADRGVHPEEGDPVRLVEFWIVDKGQTVTIRVVESGFASMPVPVDEQLAQYEQNTRTWQHQLELARDRLRA